MLTPRDHACARIILERELAAAERVEEAMTLLARVRVAGLPTDLLYVCVSTGLLTDLEASGVRAEAERRGGESGPAAATVALPRDGAPRAAETLAPTSGRLAPSGGSVAPVAPAGLRTPRPTPLNSDTMADSGATLIGSHPAARTQSDAGPVTPYVSPRPGRNPGAPPTPAAATAIAGASPDASDLTLQLPADADPEASAPAAGAGPALVSRRMGDYLLVRELGRGGMGVVYEAVQVSLNRRVALKVLNLTSQDGTAIERFKREAENVARLNHKHIIRVYGAGNVDGVYFYAMEYLDGRSVADLARHEPLTARRAAELVAQAADALHFAHANNIVHRDIKPANLLLDREGNLVLTDFGLARDIGAQSLTATGQVLGTPHYMPPEQAEGKLDQVDARSDIYSLGATLYELLARRPLFDGDSIGAVLRKVIFEEPATLRSAPHDVPRDLETIALKCLNKEQERRYGSALALKEDLDRWLRGEPIVAQRMGPLERGWRTVRRHKLATVGAAALALSAGVVAWGWDRSGYVNDLAAAAALLQKDQRDAALAKYEELIRTRPRLTEAYIGRGIVHLRERRYPAAVADFDQALALDPRSLAARTERGNVFAAQGNVDLALAEYGKALEQEAGHVPALLQRATVCARCGRLGDALADLDRVLAAEPGNLAARLERGRGRAELGLLAEAATDFALAAGATDAEPRARGLAGTAEVLAEAGKLDEALAAVAAARKTGGAPGWVALAEARCLRLAGRTEAVQELLTPALERAETRRAAQVELATALLWMRANPVALNKDEPLSVGNNYDRLDDLWISLRRDHPANPWVLWSAAGAHPDPDRAVGDLRACLAVAPIYPRAQADLALFAVYAERPETDPARRDALRAEALARAEAALRVAPRWQPALAAKAHVLAATDATSAAAFLDELLAAEPECPQYLALRAELYARLGQGDKARADYAAARALWRAGAGDAARLLARARDLGERSLLARNTFGNQTWMLIQRAHQLTEAALRREPNCAAAWGDLARWLVYLRKLSAGVAAIDRALLADPFDAELYRIRAEFRCDLREVRDLPGALADASRAVELAPDAWWTWDLRAGVRLAAGDADREAIAGDLDRAAACADAGAALWYHRAELYRRLSEPERVKEALARLETAPADHPRSRYFFWLTENFDNQTMEANIPALLDRAEALDPRDADIPRERAGYLFGHKEWLKAFRPWSRAIELDPNLSAQFYENLFRHARGGIPWPIIEQLAANNAKRNQSQPYDALIVAWINTWMGRYDQANAWVERALKLRADLPLAYAVRAMNLHAQKDEAGAEAELKKALAAYPKLILGHYGLARVYAVQGRTDEAIAELQQAWLDGLGGYVYLVMEEPDLKPLQADPRFRKLTGRDK
ncbi:MAG: protein kinase [Planctomycetes bacterium]|nr:protein kinase [Planctomycetota bacterium]